MTVALLSAAFLGACLADPNPRVPNYLGALEPEDAAWLDSLESLDENKDLPPLPVKSNTTIRTAFPFCCACAVVSLSM
eukprot:1394960-Amorphochlora_amoeboformis.AAC.2